MPQGQTLLLDYHETFSVPSAQDLWLACAALQDVKNKIRRKKKQGRSKADKEAVNKGFIIKVLTIQITRVNFSNSNYKSSPHQWTANEGQKLRPAS